MTNRSVKMSIACGLSAVAGYLLANHPISGKEEFGDSKNQARHPQVERFGVDETMAKPTAKDRTAEQLTALKEKLLQQFKNSPAAAQDWVFRGQIQAILVTLNEEELQELVRDELVSVEPGSFRSWDSAKHQFFEAVILQWTILKPADACQALLDINSFSLSKAFRLWQKRDPYSAQAWLEHADFPEKSQRIKSQLVLRFLDRQVTTDFSAAKETLASLDLETQKKALLSWSQLVARDPTRRQEYLALLANRGDADSTEACFQSLVKEMARQSPAEAAAFVEASDLTEDRKDQLSHTLIGEWALKQPKEAFAAWAELKEDSAPEPLLRAIESWSLNFPGVDESIHWVKSLDAGPAREQFKEHLIEGLISGERFAQVADLSASLDDPAERIRQLKVVKRVWEERWKPGCDAWFAKLPEEIRRTVEQE